MRRGARGGKGHDWPKASMVVPKEDVVWAVRQMRDAHKEEWRKYRSLMWFLAEEYPERWEEVRQCRTEFYVRRSQVDPEKAKVTLKGCGSHPFCPACAEVAKWTRTMKRVESFRRCTPKVEEPRVWYVVYDAPSSSKNYPGRPGNFGDRAREDVGRFGKFLHRTLVRAYGRGVGVAATHHDVGEELWARPHPHLDVLLNGWRVEEGEVLETLRFDFEHGGMTRRWQPIVKEEAMREWKLPEAEPGNVRVHGPFTGVVAVTRRVAYQMREVIDFRKLEYSKSQAKVWWKDYRNNFHRQEFTVDEFKQGLGEYSVRLDAWNGHGRRYVDRMYGHMADGEIGRTQEVMGGGAVGHAEGCACAVCHHWQVVWDGEAYGAAGIGEPVDPEGV